LGQQTPARSVGADGPAEPGHPGVDRGGGKGSNRCHTRVAKFGHSLQQELLASGRQHRAFPIEGRLVMVQAGVSVK